MAVIQNLFRVRKTGAKTCAACGCCRGYVRTNNEDNFCFAGQMLPQENDGMAQILTYEADSARPVVFGVFDGMGGEAAGEVAAHFAASELCAASDRLALQPEKKLLQVCTNANARICAYGEAHKTGMMGSTVVILYLAEEHAVAVNLGDSRLYRLRDGILKQCSVDHTSASKLSENGNPRRKPSLTQHLGIDPREMIIEPDVWTDHTQPGDVFLLCSDGLTDMLKEEAILQILMAESSCEARVRRLLESALAAGGRDNVTVIVCECIGKS